MKLDLKGWLFRTFVADAALKQVYQAVDAYCTKRWPVGWPRVQFALSGWITKLGLVMGGVAMAALWAVDRYREGGDPVTAAKVGLYAAAVVVGIGLLRKLVKWALYFETTDKDGWLDDPKAVKPGWLDDNEKALVGGRLQDIRGALVQARNLASVDAHPATIAGQVNQAITVVDAAQRDLRKLPVRR